MAAKQAEVAAAINHFTFEKTSMNSIQYMNQKSFLLYLLVLLLAVPVVGQTQDALTVYKKRVLESAEMDFLSSYYSQDGDNAAVSGGIGTEELTDATATIVVAIPLNDDDILSIDAGVSAYTSASSSNVNPFDGGGSASPFVASSGASGADVWGNFTTSYTHNSDDRNEIWSGKVSISAEYDYFSAGVGGSFTKLFNQKNTELSMSANVYFDTWSLIYPSELRGGGGGRDNDDDDDFNINNYTITGNTNYNPNFTPLSGKGRNSYAVGLGFSQILTKNIQGALALDVIQQSGTLSTPFQRVYFSDVEDSFIEDFHLAEDIERLPGKRLKVAVGGRLNYFLNEYITVRSFYRYYFDDWGITSHTASIELPIKLGDKFTIYPSYRYYSQTAADYFLPYNEHLSTTPLYTSDYDLSSYNSNQFGFGIGYTDIFTKFRLWKIGLKSIDVKFYQYDRNTTFNSSIITAGFKFVLD